MVDPLSEAATVIAANRPWSAGGPHDLPARQTGADHEHRERALLTRFLDELASARAGTKDGEAEAMIARTLSANTDAAYLLIQHAIVADQSLHAAQQRIADLEQQQAAPAPASSSFLPQTAAGPWGSRGQDAYAPPPVDQRPGIFSISGGSGSFLRTAGTTAAGVAGGEMLSPDCPTFAAIAAAGCSAAAKDT